MPCQVCGKPSGYYPLCPGCFRARAEGAVAKCEGCEQWARVVEGACAACQAEVEVPGQEITQWAKRIWRASSSGMKRERDDERRRSHERARKVGEQVYGRMTARESHAPVPVARRVLHLWAGELEDQANAALAGGDGADAKHLMALMEVAESMRRAADLPSPPPQRVEGPGQAGAPAQAGTPAQAEEPPPTRLVVDRQIPRVVQQMVKEAREELLIISPWIYGVDHLIRELVEGSRTVRVRIITRRPAPHEDAHRQTLEWLNSHDRIDLMAVDRVHAKIVVRDGAMALVGSANLVAASMERNQEAAILTGEAGVVADAQAYFGALYREARAQRMGLAPS